jgi:hypothetical protein
LKNIFFETFCEHVPWNKLRGSTNFIIFGHMSQKLWENKKFRRSMDRVGKYLSQPTRIDHMCKKMWARGRRRILQGRRYGHLRRRGG